MARHIVNADGVDHGRRCGADVHPHGLRVVGLGILQDWWIAEAVLYQGEHVCGVDRQDTAAQQRVQIDELELCHRAAALLLEGFRVLLVADSLEQLGRSVFDGAHMMNLAVERRSSHHRAEPFAHAVVLTTPRALPPSITARCAVVHSVRSAVSLTLLQGAIVLLGGSTRVGKCATSVSSHCERGGLQATPHQRPSMFRCRQRIARIANVEVSDPIDPSGMNLRSFSVKRREER